MGGENIVVHFILPTTESDFITLPFISFWGDFITLPPSSPSGVTLLPSPSSPSGGDFITLKTLLPCPLHLLLRVTLLFFPPFISFWGDFITLPFISFWG